MGKGISLEKLNQRNRQVKPAKVRRRPNKDSVLKSERQIIREWGQQLHEFERQHFCQYEREEETHPYVLYSVLGFFVITVAVLFYYAALEVYSLNKGNYYFWLYLLLIPFVIITKDRNWKILGLIVLFGGFSYWSWTWVMTDLFYSAY